MLGMPYAMEELYKAQEHEDGRFKASSNSYGFLHDKCNVYLGNHPTQVKEALGPGNQKAVFRPPFLYFA